MEKKKQKETRRSGSKEIRIADLGSYCNEAQDEEKAKFDDFFYILQ